MNEKRLVVGVRDIISQIIPVVVGAVVFVLGVILYLTNYANTRYYYVPAMNITTIYGTSHVDGRTTTRHFINQMLFEGHPLVGFLIDAGIILIILGIIFFILCSRQKLVVTEEGVSGATLTRRINIPFSSVKTVSLGGLKGITFGTSSGKTGFVCIKNNEDIQHIVSAKITDSDKGSAQKTINEQPMAPDLMKLKEYLDAGIITAEEFEVKKKQILGL